MRLKLLPLAPTPEMIAAAEMVQTARYYNRNLPPRHMEYEELIWRAMWLAAKE